MLKIEENKSLIAFNTFGVNVKANYFTSVESENEILEILQSKRFNSMNKLILGGGSNILFTKNYDGLVIEASGIGNLPTSVLDRYTKDHKKIFNALKILTKKTVVVLAAQTIFGRLNMNVYSNQREMQEIGVLGHLNDMTPETTFVKLSWLLSNYKKDAKDLLFENLKGEINERLMSNEFLDENF